MRFNPVADAWWEKSPGSSILQAFEPRKGARAGAYVFCGARPALEEVEDRWEKSRSVFILFMHCRLSERPANLNTKYKIKGAILINRSP
jgi:hypothetical protein